MPESLYYQRYSSKIVKEALSDTPVVFIMGARQSGKTTLVKALTNQAWTFLINRISKCISITKSV